VARSGAALCADGGNADVLMDDGAVRQRYGVHADGAAYLLRPDQHICARWVSLDATRLQAALATAAVAAFTASVPSVCAGV
jgi:3-(3-hydroxy-phenyl)propionate hydroxylase